MQVARSLARSLAPWSNCAFVGKGMSERQDPFALLGISRNAAKEEIKAAYLRLAKRWHPDGHPPETQQLAEREFKKVTEAYERCGQLQRRNNNRTKHESAHAGTGSQFKRAHEGDLGETDTKAYWRAFRRASATRDATGFASFTAAQREVAEPGTGPWSWLLHRAGLWWRRAHRGAHATTLLGALVLGGGLSAASTVIGFLWEKRNASHSFEHMMQQRASKPHEMR